jgi:hypothetical protein
MQALSTRQVWSARLAAALGAIGLLAAPAVAGYHGVVVHNQTSNNVTVSDNLGMFTGHPPVTPGTTATGQYNGWYNVYSNVTLTDATTGASCYYQTQSVYSSYYGHWQITYTYLSPGKSNAATYGGVVYTPICNGSFT